MRVSRERLYMDVAQAFAKRSTCYRNNVGAVIVCTDGWVINGTGYNGPPPGDVHCKGNDCELTAFGACERSIHAEMNALERMQYPIMGAQWMFTTRSPCIDCSNSIRDSGAISRVYYEEPYRDKTGLHMLRDAKIECYRVLPSGVVMDEFDHFIIAGE